MRVWQAHTGMVWGLTFSPDGRLLATTAGGSKFVWLWDATTGELVRKLGSDSPDAARGVAFLPDGGHLVSFSDGRRGGCVWAVGSGEVVARLQAGSWRRYDSVAVSPDGGRVVYPIVTGLAVWDEPRRPTDRPRRYDRLHRVQDLLRPDNVWVGYSTAGTWLWRADRYAYLHDPATLRVRRRLADAPCGATSALAFSTDELRMAGGFGNRAVVWRLDEPKAEPQFLEGHGGQVRAVGFLPGQRTLVTAGMDGTARVWDADAGVQRRSLDWGIGKVRAAAVAADGTRCAAGGAGGQVVIWDVDE
jgi:WD40 repeat protein